MLEDLGIVGMMGGLGALPPGLVIDEGIPFDPYAPLSEKEKAEIEQSEKHMDTPISPSRELKED